MSTTNLTAFNLICDYYGIEYVAFLPTIDAIRQVFLTQATNSLNLAASNPYGWNSASPSPDQSQAIQISQMFQQITSKTQTAGLSVSGLPLGNLSPSGVTSAQNGFWQRPTAIQSAFGTGVKLFTSDVATYSTNTAIVDIPSYLANTSGAYASASFASLYWWIYGNQLTPATVFPPTGIVLGSFTITGTNTGTFTAGSAYPTANGYTSPAPTQDSYGNNVFVGGCPVAQGFAPSQTIKALITTNINGTCTVIVNALNQLGAHNTWSGVLDNATAGTSINLTSYVGGNYCNSALTAINISGTATSGAFAIETVSLR